jgi:hypothetical protein
MKGIFTSEQPKAAHWSTLGCLRKQVQAQGPADLRSVTVTSVHPLALEHTAILRAHFGVCGRIVRATVLRNQGTGEPSEAVSSGMMHATAPILMRAVHGTTLEHGCA